MGVEAQPPARKQEQVRPITSKSEDDDGAKPDYNFKFSPVRKRFNERLVREWNASLNERHCSTQLGRL